MFKIRTCPDSILLHNHAELDITEHFKCIFKKLLTQDEKMGNENWDSSSG